MFISQQALYSAMFSPLHGILIKNSIKNIFAMQNTPRKRSNSLNNNSFTEAMASSYTTNHNLRKERATK